MAIKYSIRLSDVSKIRSIAAFLVLISGSSAALVESVGPNGVNARIVHEQGLTGDGIHIAMLSSGNARATHEAFARPNEQNAVINHDFSGNGPSRSAHDTQVAAIIVSGGGAEYPDCRGVAPGARLHSARISDGAISAATIDRALRELIVNNNCRVVVTGVQMPSSAVRPNGESPWSRMYDYYAERYDVVFANAAGNSEAAVTVFGDGYNGITTGGLALDDQGRHRVVGSISNVGPTVDGRQKPELVAPAQRLMLPGAGGDALWSPAGSARGETSFATPHTAGVAALLAERIAHNNDPQHGQSILIKAILINTANPDVQSKDGISTDSDALWHPHRGYGLLDAGRALTLLDAGRIRPDDPVEAAAGWAVDTLDNNARNRYRLRAGKGQRLLLTAAWHRKLIRYSPVSYVEEAPRFYLRIEVKSPDGATLYAHANADDNLHKLELRLPDDGIYEILTINPVHQSERVYALAFELLDEATP